MNRKIYETLANFEREDGFLQQVNEDGIYITDAIEQTFAEAGFEPSAYSIESSIVFSCPSADFGYVSIAWIEDGKLRHQTYEFEQ